MQNRENELYKRVYRGSAITSGMYSNPQNKLPSDDIGVINPNNLDTVLNCCSKKGLCSPERLWV